MDKSSKEQQRTANKRNLNSPEWQRSGSYRGFLLYLGTSTLAQAKEPNLRLHCFSAAPTSATTNSKHTIMLASEQLSVSALSSSSSPSRVLAEPFCRYGASLFPAECYDTPGRTNGHAAIRTSLFARRRLEVLDHARHVSRLGAIVRCNQGGAGCDCDCDCAACWAVAFDVMPVWNRQLGVAVYAQI